MVKSKSMKKVPIKSRHLNKLENLKQPLKEQQGCDIFHNKLNSKNRVEVKENNMLEGWLGLNGTKLSL